MCSECCESDGADVCVSVVESAGIGEMEGDTLDKWSYWKYRDIIGVASNTGIRLNKIKSENKYI